MSYRPICDTWILARPKLKDKQRYYGAYPAGFLHRARQLLGVRWTDAVLHVCGGMVKENLYRGFGPKDKTLDMAPETFPDFLIDAREIGAYAGCLFPDRGGGITRLKMDLPHDATDLWPAILIDRPYTEEDHTHYDVPADIFPADLNDLLRSCLSMVEPGGRVGVLDYLWPHPGKGGKEVAVVGVGTGRNNRARWFTVFEKVWP